MSTVIAGIPLHELAAQWKGSSRRSVDDFVWWLQHEKGFPKQYPSSRVLIGRSIRFFTPNRGPHDGRERHLGELFAFGKGLVIFHDAASSPSLSGPVVRSSNVNWPLVVIPFYSLANTWLSRRPGMYACHFGSRETIYKLAPEEVLFHRHVRDDNESHTCMLWGPLEDWMKHWLPN